VVDILRLNPKTRVEVQGHADGRVGVGENKRLGERRAEEVKRLLVLKGIDASRPIRAECPEPNPGGGITAKKTAAKKIAAKK
jgi:outer membrane protein OmpA-like peptidoglycan-associated protein